MERRSIDPEEFLAFAPGLRRLAARLVGAEHADDLVQDTWVRALEQPPQEEKPLGPWLVRVLSNLAISSRRKTTTRREREREVGVAALDPNRVPSPEEITEELEAADKVMAAVSELDELHRTVVSLRYFRGHSSAEIGKLLGLPAPTVRWHLQSAMARMRMRLADRNDGTPGGWVAAITPLLRITTSPAVNTGASVAALGPSTWIAAALVLTLTFSAWFDAFTTEGPRDPLGPSAKGLAQRSLQGKPPANETVAQPKVGRANNIALEIGDASPQAGGRTQLTGAPVTGPSASAPVETAASAGAAQASDPTPGPITTRTRLRCKLVDTSGLPISGGEIAITDSGLDLVVSDQDGRCIMTVAAPAHGPQSLASRLHRTGGILVRADGFASRRLPVRQLFGADLSLGDVALVRGPAPRDTGESQAEALESAELPPNEGSRAQLALLVVGPDNRPVPQAVATIYRGPFESESFNADRNGIVRAPLRRGEPAEVIASDRSLQYAPARSRSIAFDGQRVTLQLPESRILTVTIEGPAPTDLRWFELASLRNPSAVLQSGRWKTEAPLQVPVPVGRNVRRSEGGLVFEAKGFAPATIAWRKFRKSDEITFKMKPSTAISGRVFAAGRPHGEARISVATPTGVAANDSRPTIAPRFEVTSATLASEDGTFTVAIPNGMPYVLTVSAEGYAPLIRRYIGMGRPKDLDAIQLKEGGTLIGQIGSPQAPPRGSMPSFGPPMQLSATDCTGRQRTVQLNHGPTYQVNGLEPGTWTLELQLLDGSGKPSGAAGHKLQVEIFRGTLSYAQHEQ